MFPITTGQETTESLLKHSLKIAEIYKCKINYFMCCEKQCNLFIFKCSNFMTPFITMNGCQYHHLVYAILAKAQTAFYDPRL